MKTLRPCAWGLGLLGVIGLLWWLLSKKQQPAADSSTFPLLVGLTPPLVPLRIRSDIRGSGAYRATRIGHAHHGIDILCQPGQVVRAPFAGRITQLVYPYPTDHRWQGFELQNSGNSLSARVYYCIPTAGLIGQSVQQGQAIATAQAIATKYGPGMKNHLHLELRKNGVVVDPTPYFVFS